jgi:divalent metal cation (Fe/Co/Zn/Cd) transporter
MLQWRPALQGIYQMSIKWIGTLVLAALFLGFVVLPSAMICGFSPILLAAAILGVLVSYLLFAATEFYYEAQPTTELQSSESVNQPRSKASRTALVAVAFWVLYVMTLLSLGWTGWWWALAGVYCVVSLLIVLDLAGTVLIEQRSNQCDGHPEQCEGSR